MNLKGRLAAVEAAVIGDPGEMRFDIETWKREQEEGVSLAEQERRRLAEYPDQAARIREIFRVIGERRARMEAQIADWKTWHPDWQAETSDDDGGDSDGSIR